MRTSTPRRRTEAGRPGWSSITSPTRSRTRTAGAEAPRRGRPGRPGLRRGGVRTPAALRPAGRDLAGRVPRRSDLQRPSCSSASKNRIGDAPERTPRAGRTRWTTGSRSTRHTRSTTRSRSGAFAAPTSFGRYELRPLRAPAATSFSRYFFFAALRSAPSSAARCFSARFFFRSRSCAQRTRARSPRPIGAS
jgi:hypothetical protein